MKNDMSENVEDRTSKQVVLKPPLTSSESILALLFGFGFILGFLLTPLGVETRMPELRTLAFAGFFITVGLLIPLAGLVTLWLRRSRLAGSLAVINAVLIFLTAPADQALFFLQFLLRQLYPQVNTFSSL